MAEKEKDTITLSVKNVDKALWAKLKYDATIENKTVAEKLNEVLRDRK